MILQTCLVPDEVCADPEIYYRNSGALHTEDGSAFLQAGQEMNSCTYMNALDVGAWKKYTSVETIRFRCRLKGRGTIALIHRDGGREMAVEEVRYGEDPGQGTVELELPANIRSGVIYFNLKAESETVLEHAEYRTESPPGERISLSLVICTYRRKEHVERNLEKLRKSSFFRMMTQKNRFVVRVVDNGKELPDTYGEGIKVYANENTGGSGGFSRGMDESVNERDRYETTHVVLMDDDVELQTESLWRLYALLTYIRPEYRREPVAGRMFRLDRREVQYTAAEIWNGGDIRHIGFNLDMTRPENLASLNDNEGAEYGGWWFACYPMEFVEKNRPLPFFLHCDDVEYGLRHGGTPIVLNGIQVWHETYEYRQSPVIAYYDTRNALIVNALYVQNQNKKDVICSLEKAIELVREESLEEAYTRLLGIFHFCLGPIWFRKKRQLLQYKTSACKFTIIYKTVFRFWPLLFYRIQKSYGQNRKS